MHTRTLIIAALALAALPALAHGQRRTRQQPIEIRGQVPTPQVVTVRPREVPAYSRQVLVPNFYDHDFWPSILPAYQLVPQRMLTGEVPGDTTRRAAGDTTGVRPALTPADTLRRPSPAAADTTRGGTGTPPAPTPR